MSKRASVMVSLSLLSILSACDGNNASSPPPADPTASSAPAVPALAAGTIGPWTSPATNAATSELCSLDDINGVGAKNAEFNASVGQNMTFEGWVASADKKAPGSIAIVLDGPADFQIAGSTGVARDDVVTAYGPGVANAGFKIPVPTLNVPPGKYNVLIASVGNPSGFTCNTKTQLIVK